MCPLGAFELPFEQPQFILLLRFTAAVCALGSLTPSTVSFLGNFPGHCGEVFASSSRFRLPSSSTLLPEVQPLRGQLQSKFAIFLSKR
jgi:hypothetical protein